MTNDQSIKLQRSTLREQIKDYIYTQIKSGVYEPGSRISETGLARELGVSQSPVREAILELSAMGLLEEKPYSGTFVRKLTPEDIEDIYDVRAYIEKYAITRAVKFMTDEEINAIQPVIDEMEKAVSDKNVKAFNDTDINFHRLILEGAKSNTLMRVWKTLQMGQWTSYTLMRTKKSLENLLEEHKLIYNHLIDRESDKASSAIYSHIKNLCHDVITHMESSNEE